MEKHTAEFIVRLEGGPRYEFILEPNVTREKLAAAIWDTAMRVLAWEDDSLDGRWEAVGREAGA